MHSARLLGLQVCVELLKTLLEQLHRRQYFFLQVRDLLRLRGCRRRKVALPVFQPFTPGTRPLLFPKGSLPHTLIFFLASLKIWDVP